MELATIQDERRLESEHERVVQQQTHRPVTTRVRDALRRFTQRHIVGKVREETAAVFNQDEYATERAKYMDLLHHVKAQEGSLKQLAQCVSQLGGAMLNVGECNARIKMDRSDTRFADMMRQIQGKTMAYGPSLEQHVLPQLRHHVERMEALLPQMHQRENLESDYFTAVHKHERAKRKGKLQAIKETGQQMDAAQHALVVVTRVLLAQFKMVQASKGRLTEETLQLTCRSMGHLMHQMMTLASVDTAP
ncbi:hypothetical protein H310_03742 [Aphanomyces invadans]|uniref:BAR domain-containing protein n=1 Tax=Aphanomyces invadans TaxID=157072 RepID=A0A024UIY6_9STRA|nr:hypothetical protein H310_03742 [Aphanomyces invadans]ETW06160.1 hypothetical protein H310_03742 [Aphanomyces invadans]|eukprot:XP_008865937.1 hypothetical protein H310_03742 [Aphanomyces invadans]